MKKNSLSNKLFILGFMLLLATNIGVFLGVASNRSGNLETLIELTERELRLPYMVHEENSGLSLQLTWRSLGEIEDDSSYYYTGHSPFWLNADKLRRLGFKFNETITPEKPSKRYKEQVPKEVFIVLEYNGDAYIESVKRAENAFERASTYFKANPEDKGGRFNDSKKRLERERNSLSRLFAVDAGLDAVKLRKLYSDRNRFMILSGTVNTGYIYNKSGPYGYISNLSVENIHVPLKLRDTFDSILVKDKSEQYELKSPRYSVELAYGKRFEPWIRSVHPMKE
jgi:hypothetical protein